MSTETTQAPAPRIRFAAITWGTILAIISVTTILVIGDPAARQVVGDFLTGITVASAILVGVVIVGGIILVGGLLTMIHRAQSRTRDSA